MLRPSSLPHALAAVTAGAVGTLLPVLAATPVAPVAPARAAAVAPADPDQPLVPRIRSITPDYLPDKGPVVVRGTVTNASDQTWTAINVHGFLGSTAMTTASELVDAARTPLTADVGHRITVPGTFDSIRSLAPGETARFVVRLPRATLQVSLPGVYWFGVHVLGDNGEGGPRVAVGRDRTFLPYVPSSSIPAGAQEYAALVVPVRAGVARGPTGAGVDAALWGRRLATGPLHAALAIGRAARGRPLTWLVDPAVPDVVRRLRHGNPPRTLSARSVPGKTSPSTSPSAGPSRTPAATGSESATSSAASASEGGVRGVAHRWLRDLHALLASSSSQILGLPYGDLDLETAAQYDVPLLRAGYHHTGHALRPWHLPLTPVAAPPDGRTTGETVSQLPSGTTVLLDDAGVRDPAPAVDRMNGHRVILASSTADQGGPGPVDPQSSLALRQRVLAEAAVRLLADQQPLVVELPTQAHHPLGPRFFSGLDVPWLQLTTLDGATAVGAAPLHPSRLIPRSDEAPTLGPRLYVTAQNLLDQGATLQSVLGSHSRLRKELFEEVTGNASYAASSEPFLAAYRMRGIARWVRDSLDGIDLAAPEWVTLASTSGRFSAIVSNALDVPVTVEVHAASDRQLQITGGETVQLAPHGRTTVLLHASTSQRGVHTVTLSLTSPDGDPLGPHARDSFPMRAEQVSRLIWVIIGAGVALLFAAIVVRLFRRAWRGLRGTP